MEENKGSVLPFSIREYWAGPFLKIKPLLFATNLLFHALFYFVPDPILSYNILVEPLQLREVRYMAGHRYVSSTVRYRTDNLVDLQKELEKFHPLK
jgi:hypothetical protein